MLQRLIREALDTFTPADWVFSRIERGGDAVGLDDKEEHSARRTSKGAYRDIEDVLGALDGARGAETGLSGAERIRLVATITLRAVPPDAWPASD